MPDPSPPPDPTVADHGFPSAGDPFGGRESRKIMRKVRKALAQTDADVDLDLVFECTIAWETMQPLESSEDPVRLCTHCDSRVYDLTDTPKSEVLTLIRRNGDGMCGQVRIRSDRRVVFGECTQEDSLHMMRGRIAVRES